MKETDAAAVLLAREIEIGPPGNWSRVDSSRADEEARCAVGEKAAFEVWLCQRATWIVEQVHSRKFVGGMTAEAAWWASWITAAVVMAAFATGVATDAVGPARRINILAPPLLALLLWNIAVYVVLALRLTVWRSSVRDGPLRRALGAILERGVRVAFASASRENAELLVRFARAWAGSSRSLWSVRVAATLHAAATALVLGALCSMYVRGVVLEYRAGWESTFLGAPGVHAIITTVLGPAAQLSGIALPNVAQLAALADAAGPGENAARWIHLYAITLALVVILPRSILALVAASRARRLGRNFALPLDDDYFVRLRRAWSGRPTTIEVLPYSYHVNAAQGAALRTALERLVAPKVELKLLDTAPLGAEDNLGRWLGADRSSDPGGDLATSPLLAVLFSMAATPEREHHGALLRALTAHRPRQRLLAIVDESTMRRRLPGAEHVARLEERRRAWRTLLGDAGPSPVFIDLDATGEARAAGASSSATRS